jgi:hypothetical protein
MMDRYTRKDAENAFERLLTATGNRRSTSWNDVGGWNLDYAACYGGYVVEEVNNPSGGISQPFGSQRRTAREFVDCVRFACDAISLAKESVK